MTAVKRRLEGRLVGRSEGQRRQGPGQCPLGLWPQSTAPSCTWNYLHSCQMAAVQLHSRQDTTPAPRVPCAPTLHLALKTTHGAFPAHHAPVLPLGSGACFPSTAQPNTNTASLPALHQLPPLHSCPAQASSSQPGMTPAHTTVPRAPQWQRARAWSARNLDLVCQGVVTESKQLVCVGQRPGTSEITHWGEHLPCMQLIQIQFLAPYMIP